MENSKRIEWIDIMKGIGIVLVVIGHVVSVSVEEDRYIFQTIYLFHMPLFFYISGYTYKKSDIKVYTIKKTYQLLIPYFSLLILFLPVSIYIFPHETDIFTSNTISESLIKYFAGRTILNRVTGVLWFLPVLYFTSVVYNIICKFFSFTLTNIIVIVFLILSYYNSLYYSSSYIWLPLYFHLILATIPFFHIGHLFNKYSIKINIYILGILLLIPILGIIYSPNNINNIVDCFYGIPIFTFICSIIMIIFVQNLSILISRLKVFTSFFSLLGRASLIIMAFHFIFILTAEKFISSNNIIIIIISTISSLGIYYICKKFTITRALFMGKMEDIQLIIQKLTNIIK